MNPWQRSWAPTTVLAVAGGGLKSPSLFFSSAFLRITCSTLCSERRALPWLLIAFEFLSNENGSLAAAATEKSANSKAKSFIVDLG